MSDAIEFEDFRLPCDVKIGDHMRIGKGCKMSTLLGALQRQVAYADRPPMSPEDVAAIREQIRRMV